MHSRKFLRDIVINGSTFRSKDKRVICEQTNIKNILLGSEKPNISADEKKIHLLSSELVLAVARAHINSLFNPADFYAHTLAQHLFPNNFPYLFEASFSENGDDYPTYFVTQRFLFHNLHLSLMRHKYCGFTLDEAAKENCQRYIKNEHLGYGQEVGRRIKHESGIKPNINPINILFNDVHPVFIEILTADRVSSSVLEYIKAKPDTFEKEKSLWLYEMMNLV